MKVVPIEVLIDLSQERNNERQPKMDRNQVFFSAILGACIGSVMTAITLHQMLTGKKIKDTGKERKGKACKSKGKAYKLASLVAAQGALTP